MVGLDFSAPAIAAARQLTAELHLESRAHFVQADLYDAPKAVPEPHGFDLVFVTWGAICWLPDIRRWAEIVANLSSRVVRCIWLKAIRPIWCSIVVQAY